MVRGNEMYKMSLQLWHRMKKHKEETSVSLACPVHTGQDEVLTL
jgi:hypothetical protein